MSSRAQQGVLWLQQQAMERGRRIAIPLKVEPLPPGTLRIILPANGQAAIHDAVEGAQVCGTRGCGDVAVGVDKGCTEVHLDRDGERHQARLGNRLSAESDHRRQVRDHLRQAAHSMVDQAGTIACEDLSAPMQSAPYRPRRLNGWGKGVMAETLTAISRRRGSAPALVNPASNSQIDSRTVLSPGTYREDRYFVPKGLCRMRISVPPVTIWRGWTTTGKRWTSP